MATQLIPVFTGTLQHDTTQLCNARDLHAALKVETRFNDWMERRIADYGFVEGQDFWSFDYSKVSNQKGRGGDRRSRDIRLTLDMAKELAMLENNEVGRMVRRYFIQAEAELRAELRDKASHVLPLPGVKKMARDGLRLKETLILREQSRKTLEHLLAAGHPAQRLNLWHQLRQVNDALGIPTASLAEIDAAPLGLTIREG